MKPSYIFCLGLLLLTLGCLAWDGAPSIPTTTHPQESASAAGTTYYVRADGGDAQECTGLADAPYPGSGTNQSCSWDHPFRALPPMGGAPRIAGGDTLIVRAGAYRMGYGAPGADDCYADGSFDCLIPPIPSGPDAAHPTRILGAGWDSGCANPPQLWGAERPWFIVNLTDSSNVELGCLEITDHSSCVEFHTGGLACQRDTAPYGDWASIGLYAEDSTNVYLHDLNIHGLASGGVHAGRLADWTVERVRIAGNGSVGWDGDLWDDNGDSNSGDLIFRHFTVEWNGCGETYPGLQPTGCWAQTAGGYGDGFGTGTSGGNWLFEDSSFRFNTSDGLDLLYISEAGSSVTIRRSTFEGNAGNQVKNYRGPFLLENSVIVGDCGFFDGQPFTYNVDNCRALGNALSLGLTRGDQATITNNTFTSEGDCLVTAECSSGNCNGSERAILRNNIFQGQVDFLQPFEQTCLVYQETFPSDPFDADYSLINDVKDSACPGAHDLCGIPPGLADASIDSFNPDLLADSPAIDAADASACPATDLRGVPRPQGGGCDIGAYEYIASLASPFVLSILRADANPTGASAVDFTVTFSEPVTGVTLDDFSLTTTGVSGATLSGLNGSDASYTLTVSTGSGSGTLRLDLFDNDSILDADLNPLGGAGAGNGDFTSGETYDIVKGVELVAPFDTEDTHTNRPAFQWNALIGAVSYQIQISLDNTFATPALKKTLKATLTSYVPTKNLLPNTAYYWRVRAKVGKTYGIWSETWSFTTGNPPPIPVLTSPGNKKSVAGPSPLFDWKDVKAVAGVIFSHYEIQVSTNANFPTFETGTPTDSQYDGFTLSPGTYYWRVRSVADNDDFSAWSSVRMVIVQ